MKLEWNGQSMQLGDVVGENIQDSVDIYHNKPLYITQGVLELKPEDLFT